MASCAEPFGNEGDVLYNAEIANLTYCDGTNWNRINDSYGIPTTGLVGHWTFGDGSGTTATDVSGNGNNGVLSNMTEADWILGEIGGAINFSSATMTVDPFPESSSSFDALTTTFWMRNYTDSDYIFASDPCIGCANGRQYRLRLYSGGLSLRVKDQGSGFCWGGFGDNSWKHVAVVWDSNIPVYRIYKNGVLECENTTDPPTGTINLSARDFWINSIDGNMDDVRIYKRALATDEVQALYEMGDGEPEDPVAYWKLDDGSGTTASDSAGANDGTLQNGPVWTGGKLGAGLRFDPSDDAVEIPSSPRLDISDNITVAAWVRLSSDDSKGRKILCNYHCGSSGGSYLTLQIYPDGANFRFKNDGGGIDAVAGNETPLNTWEHIVGTYDGSSLRIYQNGAETGSNLVSSTIATSSNPFLIGNSGQSGGGWGTDSRRNFDGVIDDVRIYDRALSTEEVEDLYQGACTNPIGRSGDIFYDADSDVVRWCGSGIWHAAGPVPGAGGTGCSDPSGVRGDIFYNVDYMVPVYCDGTYWRPMAGNPDIPTDGLIAYWSFDTGSGTTAKDWSGNGYDGTLTNMDPSSDWVTGKVGSHALDFDGTNEHVNTNFEPIWSSSDSFSTSLWFKTDLASNGADEHFLGSNNDGAGNPSMLFLEVDRDGSVCGTNQIVFTIQDDDSTANDSVCTSSYSNDQSWHHLATTYDSAGDMRIFLDGILEGTVAVTTASNGTKDFTGKAIYIAGRNDPWNGGAAADTLDGKIDDVRIYNRALTANEVKALYLNGL